MRLAERWRAMSDTPKCPSCGAAVPWHPDDPEWDATEGAHPAWWRGHDHTFRQMMRIQERETARWREAGLSLQSVRDLVTRYEQDEISVGKLVDELRGLAEAAIRARAEE